MAPISQFGLHTGRPTHRLFTAATAVAATLALVLTSFLPVSAAQAATSAPDAVTATVGTLKTNGALKPLGTVITPPDFSWQLSSTGRDVMQTGYQVLVASSVAKLQADNGDVWNSGQVDSDASTGVRYDGPDLQPTTRYFWKVKAWTNTGEDTAFSPVSWFETGFADSSEWKADWIGAPSAAGVLEDWSDYSFTTEVSAVSGAVGLYFRMKDNNNGYMWQLSNSGTDDVLRPHVKVGGGYPAGALDSVAIPSNILNGGSLAAGPNTVTIAVDGPTITTSINGTVIDTRKDASYPLGRVGFRTNGEENGIVHSALVTRDDGKVLSSTDFPPGDTTYTAGTVLAAGQFQVGKPQADSFINAQPATPLLRKDFSVDSAVASARLYASALGVYEMSINGQRVGDEELAPGWTDYNIRAQYQTYDVTELLTQGDNAVGSMLANGWYAGNLGWFGGNQYGTNPKLTAQLEITYTNGQTKRITTNDSWHTSAGPIVAADLLNGETYDASREQAGWNTAGFDASAWGDVTVADKLSTDLLVPQVDPPVRVTEELTPQTVTEITPGVWIFDLGQNMVGKTRITVADNAGKTVRLRHGEVLHADGTLSTENLRSAKATDYYTPASDAASTYTPRFTQHGFRYVELTGLTAAPTIDTLRGLVMGSDNEDIATFETSDPMVNQLQSNIVWGQRGNFLSIPTDTPARDERMGWTGDINVFASTAAFNMDSLNFLRKWMTDMRDAQRADGAYPEVAPQFCKDPAVHSSCGAGSTGWADAGITVPWTLWNAYGDTSIIRENYESMQHYIDYLTSISPGFIRPNAGTWGDWLNLGDNVPGDVLGTAFYAHSVNLMGQMARAIGHTAQADAYDSQFASIRDAFNESFVTSDGTVKGGSQTGASVAIAFDLIPDDLLAKAGKKLAEAVAARDGHLATGFLGTPSLLPALTASGQSDVAYQLLLNRSFPSWGFQIDRGATTMWERWDSIKEDGTFGDIGMNSFNHYAYGAVGNWMYTTIGGLVADEPGYKQFTIAPQPGGGLSFAKTSLDSTYGTIASDWSTHGDDFSLNVSVPANTTATVKVPAPSLASVLEAGVPAGDVTGVHKATFADGVATLSVGSGSYAFTADASAGQLSDLETSVIAFGKTIQSLADDGALTPPQSDTLLARQGDLLDAVRTAGSAYQGGDSKAAASAVHAGLAQLAKIDAYLADQKAKDVLDDRADALAKASASIGSALSELSARLLGISAHVELGANGILPGALVAASVVVDNAGSSAVTAVDARLTQPKSWKLTADSDTPIATLEPAGSSAVGFTGSVPADAEPGAVTVAGAATYSFAGAAATIPVSDSVQVDSPVTFGDVVVEPASVDPEQQFVVTATVVNNSTLTVSGTVDADVPTGWLPARSEQVASIAPGESRDYSVKLTAPFAVEGSRASIALSFVNGSVTYASTTTTLGTTLDDLAGTETDHVDLGDAASEQAHGLTASAASGTNVEAGLTRRYANRADPDGFFQFTVAVTPGKPFVVRAIETYDQAQTKEYDVSANGVVVKKRLYKHTGGLGTESYQFVVDDPAISASGEVTLRYQKVGDNYDPSIADVWVFDTSADSIAPVVTSSVKPLDARGLAGWLTGSAEVTLVGHDDHPGDVNIEQKLGDGDWSPYGAPVVVSDEGITQLSYRGTDAVGNLGEPDSVAVAIDSIAPVTTATLSPTSGDATTVNPAVVTLSATDASSGVANTSYSVDGGPAMAWTGTGISISELGDHTVRFQSTDIAGNLEVSQSVAVTVDSQAPDDSSAPTLSLDVSQQGANGWYTLGAEASVTASDTGSGVALIEYSLAGAAWTPYTDSITLPDGSYTLRYRATDVAGNLSEVGSRQVKVDSIAPSVWGWLSSGGRASVVGSDAASGFDRVEYSLDDGDTWLSSLTAVVDTDATPAALQLRGTDTAGNASAITTVTRSDSPSELTIEPGQRLLVEASGFNSGDRVSVELHSDPIVLATAIANDSGVIAAQGVVPADLAAGTHLLVFAVGTDSDGGPGAGTDPGAGNGSVTIPTTVIAATGSEISPWILASLIALISGVGAVFFARRRSTSRTASPHSTTENR